MKTKIITAVIILILLYSAGQSIYLLIKERKHSATLQNNIQNGYETGFKIVEYYKAKNGQLVAKNSVLQFNSSELRNSISHDVLAALDNLGIKPKNVTNYSNTVIQHDKEIFARVRDSVIFDTVPAQFFNYVDRWYNINGVKIGETQRLNIQSFDSITQVVYKGDRYSAKGKKLPAFCFWAKRRLQQVITSNNPASKIIFSKTISVTK